MFAEGMGSGVGMVAAMLTTSRAKFDEAIDKTEEELGSLDPAIVIKCLSF
jgi:hypothetical protein